MKFEYTIKHVGLKVEGVWIHDEWAVTLRGKETFTYKTGWGCRKPAGGDVLDKNPYAVSVVEKLHSAKISVEKNIKIVDDLIHYVSKVTVPTKPKIADVMECLTLDADSASGSTFVDWCAAFGYSDDSIKARACYDACLRTARKLANVFTREELESLRKELEERNQ